MKVFHLILVFLGICSFSLAQPPNDDPCAAIAIPVGAPDYLGGALFAHHNVFMDRRHAYHRYAQPILRRNRLFEYQGCMVQNGGAVNR